MKALIDVIRPLAAGLMAVALANCNDGCKPAEGPEGLYSSEIAACVATAKNTTESCLCRKMVDEKWGLCNHPEWPRVGRCDYVCE
jgi:hypothetical protein